MISAVADLHIASWSWHLCNLPCVYALIYSVARFSYKLCFKVSKYLFSREKKYEINRENVVYLHSTLWSRARLWLELSAVH